MNYFLILFFFYSLNSYSQDFLSFLSPHSPRTSFEVDGMLEPVRKVDSGSDRTQVTGTSVGLSQIVYDDGPHRWAVGAKHERLDVNSKQELLRDYYSIQGNVSYRKLIEKDRFWSTSITYGTASDRPFRNGKDSTIGATYLQQYNSRWFGILNYSNNRAFLNNIPLPGFFYVQELTREKAFVVGFPLLYWMRPVGNDWSFRYFGILPWTHRARLYYSKWKLGKPYLGYDQSPQSFFRHDRENQRNRFFWFEKKLVIGFEGSLLKGFRYDLSGGWAFDRQFFEARNFSEKKNFLYNLENSYFANLNIRYSF